MIVTEQKQGLRLIFLIVTIAVTTIVVQYYTTSGTRTFLQFIDASVVWDGIGNPDNIAIQGDSKLFRQLVEMGKTCETDDIYRNIQNIKNLFK